MFSVGFGRYSNAAIVFVGAGLPGVVNSKSWPQVEESPAVPPDELMHAATTSPRVLISVVGNVVPAGAPLPCEVPVAEFTYWLARVNADVRPFKSDGEEPTDVNELYKAPRRLRLQSSSVR